MSTEDQIAKVNAKFTATFANGDAAGMAAFYTDDGCFLAPNADTFRGKEAIQALMQGMFDGGVTALALTTDELDAQGDTAYEVGQYKLSAGDEVIDRGKFMVVWKNIGGQWLLHRDMINSNLPAG
ncbi:MAG: SgcJ/EcaC family oxidoreductase [Kordiimonadaceae bacterium]|jgi:uncharacterized protein (TIGR02246 family)|nr:SgcJ/EcaC family oxidoreductase [Kordiimonadaceae bacterium]